MAGDRPGLLCDVGKVLMQQHIELRKAKIMTVGERAEDVFYVTDLQQPAARMRRRRSTLKDRLLQALDQRRAT